jgi:F-type H+-transporting ATPase subunit delta
MSNENIARRYSAALADAAIAGGSAETVKSELAAWSQMFAASPELISVFNNPSIAHAGKERVVESLISKTTPSKMTANFLRVLAQNGRFSDLSEINDKFTAVLDERGGLISATITSARELPADEKSDFETQLQKMTGKQVTVSYEIDESLIGGVITRIGSTVLDGSVRSKLENLREQLING